jgi:serine/threonine protein kinase
MAIGQEASNVREFAQAQGPKRGSVIYNETTEYREMKEFLDDPGAQMFLGQFVLRQHMKETMFCWVDCRDYLEIPTHDYRRCKAIQIINKYVRTGAKFEVGALSAEIRDTYTNILDGEILQGNEANLTNLLFDKLSNECFREMVKNTLRPFKQSDEFKAYTEVHRDKSSMKVLVSDFDYMAILGQGGFGRVVHARKKSTGRHYAMKIQPKTCLIDEHGGHLANLHTEKTVFANCNHPFIVDMRYAVQTPEHAILVLALVDGGDLNDLLWRAPGGKLDEYHARLYAAQIASGLAHLHEVGVLFRDLKPENVLICGVTGNCKLTDMGLAAPIVIASKDAGPEPVSSLTAGVDEKWKKDETLISPGKSANSATPKQSTPTPANMRLLSKRMSISEGVEGGDEDAAAAATAAEVHGSPQRADDESETYNVNGSDGGEDQADGLKHLDGLTVHSNPSDITHIAEASMIPGGVGEVATTGEDAEDKRRGSMLVQHAKLDEDSTAKILRELEELAKKQAPPKDGAANPIKMTEEADVSQKRIKRMSVVGTRGYMAPEIVEGKVIPRKERRGYNETVDWFALGVTVYVMMTGCQPFSDDDPGMVDPKVLAENFPRDAKGVLRRPSGFATLLQTVRFPQTMSVSACQFCRDLLKVQPDKRLGANGYDDIKNHDWIHNPRNEVDVAERCFGSTTIHPISRLDPLVNDVLMIEGYPVPEWVYNTARSKALQRVYEPGAPPKYNHFEHVMATFDIRDQRRYVEWYKLPTKEQQEVFESWDFMSYDALKEELSVEVNPEVMKKRVPRKSRGNKNW